MIHRHPLFHDPRLAAGPPISEAMIDEAQARLGLTLPAGYCQALHQANGGPLRRTCIDLPGGERLDIPDMNGIGYETGLDGAEGSRFLAAEWDHPTPSLALFCEGRYALLLDYRSPGEPSVCWFDADTEQETVIAASFSELEQRLRYAFPGTRIALSQPRTQAEAIAFCQRLGATGPIREDWTGASNLTWQGRAVRVRPNQYRDRVVAPELGACWIFEADAPVRGMWAAVQGRDDRAILLSQGI